MSAPSLSVQTVLYGTPLDQIWQLIRSVAAAARPWAERGGRVELVIGDSSPIPLSAEAVDEIREGGIDRGLADCSYVFFDANLGSGGGHNRVAEHSGGEVIFVLNPDTYLAPTAIRVLGDALLADPSIGAAEARQIPMEHPKDYDPLTGDTSWVSGACFMTPRRVFEELGGFDAEYFPLYCDDVDYSWRLRAHGYRLVHVPDAVAFHDKRLDPDGAMVVSDTEIESGSLARLFLACRWSRPDILEETVDALRGSDHPAHGRALDAYLERESAGRLPTPLVRAADVAEFIEGNYARHRF